MAITKIEDLESTGFYNFNDEGTYYYKCSEVNQLVTHLQSKIVKWHSADEIPHESDIVFIPFTGTIHSGKVEMINGDIVFIPYLAKGGDEFPFCFTKKQVDYWCYLDDLLKILPEDK